MKGIIFTELLEMVEEQFSLDMVDQIIDSCELESGGAYTAVGTYSHEELLQLVRELSAESGIPAPALVQAFGERAFGVFASKYSVLFDGIPTAFDFLKRVEDFVHVEVLKLYPDAELPTFEWNQPADDTLVLVYSSARPFADLAVGLINGCAAHFNESLALEREDIDAGSVRFTLTHQVAA